MAPGLLSDTPIRSVPAESGNDQPYPRKPLEPTGALDKFPFEETTPVIGREYTDVNIVNDLLNANDADSLLRDLAITSMSHFTWPHTNCN